VRAIVLFALAIAGCSSVGDIELGDDGPDRFPEDDDGYGPSSATADPTDGDEPRPGSSEAGTSGSESSASETSDASTEGGSTESSGTSGDPSDLTETGGSETSTTGDGAGTNGSCAGTELPPCPPPCDVYDAPPCGLACEMGVAEGYTCGDEYGAGMTCRGGVWACFDPPPLPGECRVVCDPAAGP
jgi:hypothetical protein